jgi:hypothetical protein
MQPIIWPSKQRNLGHSGTVAGHLAKGISDDGQYRATGGRNTGHHQ